MEPLEIIFKRGQASYTVMQLVPEGLSAAAIAEIVQVIHEELTAIAEGE